MPFEIFETTSSSAIIRKTLTDLREETILASVNGLEERTAWIVPLPIREEIAKLSELIDDRGRKHRAIELARIMKGKGSKVQMIEGEYSSDGKLRQSVQRFLQKTTGSMQRLFIIAVSDVLFASLLKTAGQPIVTTDFPITVNDRSRAVLELMGRSEISDELNKAFIGDSWAAKAVREFIMRAASADDTVLITGDTGTGKEIVARQIHENSARRKKPFVAINCSAFSRDLLESELFGHTKGAFTGALKDSPGLWVSADGGTLFLDEIGELTQAHQAKLLRVLQEKRIRRVGEQEETTVSARIVCATNRDLLVMVQTGQFREDLYYRLREFLIITTPLREHAEDIPPLARTFWRNITQDEKAELPYEIVSELGKYTWPGNVRELKIVLGQLFRYFHKEVQRLDVRYLQAIFVIQGIVIPSGSEETIVTLKHRPESITSFHHLRRVYETIRAVEHILAPLLNQESPNSQKSPEISTVLTNLLKEIDLHSRTPSQFSPQTFDHINLLRSRLTYFLSEYENDPEKAIGNLQDGTHRVIEDAVADILSSIDQALVGIL